MINLLITTRPPIPIDLQIVKALGSAFKYQSTSTTKENFNAVNSTVLSGDAR